MKIYALSLVLVASIAASAAAAPGAGWFNPAGYGGQLAQPTQTFTQPAYAQPVAYRGFYGMNRGTGYSGYAGGGAGCNNCGNHGHAGTCWDCSNAWAGYCDEARGSCCGGIWDGFCGERHCNWCGHGGHRARAAITPDIADTAAVTAESISAAGSGRHRPAARATTATAAMRATPAVVVVAAAWAISARSPGSARRAVKAGTIATPASPG